MTPPPPRSPLFPYTTLFRSTIANGEIRTVSNLSRDWSQAFVDVSLAPESPIEKTMQALESAAAALRSDPARSEEHTSELQSLTNLVCRLLLEKKKKKDKRIA